MPDESWADKAAQYIKDQRAWVKRVELRKQDKVLVLSGAESHQGGWNARWHPETQGLVGQKVRVVRLPKRNNSSEGNGIVVRHLGTRYYVPFFILIKVGSKKKTNKKQGDE